LANNSSELDAVVKKPAKQPTKKASKADAPNKTVSKAKGPETALAQSARSANKFALGHLVSHPMFGDGTVTAIDADKLTIEFHGNVVKQIIDYYVKPRKP